MSAYSEVTNAFSKAYTYANSALSGVGTFTTALENAIYTPPTISVEWNSIASPTLPDLPADPTLPTIEFNDPTKPTALDLDVPTVTVDDFTTPEPDITIDAAPTVSYGVAPTVPTPDDITLPSEPSVSLPTAPDFTMPDALSLTMPSAPTITLPSTPTYLSLSTPTFAGVNLHEDFLANLETIPTLDLVAPTPFSYSVGPEYSSALLSALSAKLNERLAGGTGLPVAVESAIWDRARTRETNTAQANIDEVQRSADALGFALPTGAVAAQLRQAQQDYYDKVSNLSRDIAIKQAELEQDNLKHTIEKGIQLEGQLIDYSYKMEQLTYESAKTYAENAIAVYNAQVENYKALIGAYQTYATAYKTIIDAELAKVEVYKAELQAEQTKAQINTTLTEQYKAGIEGQKALVEVYKAELDGKQIEASVYKTEVEAVGVTAQAYKTRVEAAMSTVELYKAQLEGSKALVEIEGLKINAAAEAIKGYVAQINAETAKIEAYKAGVEAQSVVANIYKTKAEAFAAKTGAQVSKAQAEIARYNALMQGKVVEWEGYKAKVQAEGIRMDSLARQSSALIDAYRAGATAVEAKANMNARIFETEIKNYEAGQMITLQTAKANNEAILHTNNARIDAAKTGASVYAQLAGSAYQMVHATAGVGSSDQTSITYKYDGKVNADVTPLTTLSS